MIFGPLSTTSSSWTLEVFIIPLTGSLNVDTLGLTNDSTYTFDIFYCERRATGSDIQITTNIFIPASPKI